MKDRKMLLPALLSIALVFSLILTASMLNAAPVMAQEQVRLTVAADTMVSAGNYYALECDVGDWTDIIQVAAHGFYTVGLRSDGTVVAVGWGYRREEGEKGPCDVGDWADIIQVTVGNLHTVGLRSDGTLVALGDNYRGQCDVGSWTDITQVAAGGGHTVGLKSDGTVVATGSNGYGICGVGDWIAITQVAVGSGHMVGLKSDRRVVAVGSNSSGECEVGNWTGITQVAAGAGHTVGLKSDGTVVAVGYNGWEQCEIGNWMGIIQVTGGYRHTAGLKSDGTVVAVGYNEYGQCDVGNWTDIIQVVAGDFHTIGLKSGGTVVAAGGYVPCSLPSPGCFIATAAYGTPMAEEIQILRQFRDEYLLTNPLGQALVDFYYRVSQPIAEFITEHPVLKPVVRAGLLPAVFISALVVNATPVQRAIVLALLALGSVVLATWATRRRGRAGEHTRG